jgi:hypothetical protein
MALSLERRNLFSHQIAENERWEVLLCQFLVLAGNRFWAAEESLNFNMLLLKTRGNMTF